jgi:gingipain R
MFKFLKKVLAVSLLLCTVVVYGQKDCSVSFEQPREDVYQLNFNITNWDVQTVSFGGVQYQQIVFSGSAVTLEKGWAEVPFVTASVQLPAQKDVDVDVIYTEYTDISLANPLLPSRGTITRSQDPATIPYQIDPNSLVDTFYPKNLAVAEEPFIMRDVRGTTITAYPFQWNAVTKTLRVYTKMTVTLTENNQSATNPLLTENPNPIREVRGMYKSIFINYAEPKDPLSMAEYGDILVITTSRDEEAIQPYIDWKKEKGYNVEKEVVSNGTNVKSLIAGKYAANNNLMYVLLVGGWSEIQSDMASCGSLGSGPSDPMLGDVAGNASDYRAELSIGRMSASSAADVTTQVNKTIQYEKNPNMEAAWYSSYIGMGSNDNGPADDNEKDWLHIQRIYAQRMEPAYNYNQHYRLYENEGGCTKANLINYINTGASTIAYCGHGSSTSFITTGFSNSDITNLTNGTKLPFIVSVACVNGSFHNSGGNCFAEKWLKKENGGAVVTWMSTINQPWAPPMRGQDYFYDILIGGFDYSYGQYGIVTDELRTHWGAIAVNAANLMLSEVPGTDDKYTVRTWTTFGDPNLQLRTKLPATIVSSNNAIAPAINFETTITAAGSPVEGALVCLSQNGVYSKGFTDASGHISLAHPFTDGIVLFVVTAFNTTTIYETISIGDAPELFPPINLTATVELANHVVLNWDAPKETGITLVGYNVYRDGDPILSKYINPDTRTYTDIVPQNGEYTYYVTALYGDGGTMESGPSNSVTVTIDGMCMPVNSVVLEQEVEGVYEILVSWEAPEYEGTELAGYNILRNEAQINTEILPPTELSFLDEGLEPETEYCYQIEVVYNDCEEKPITEKECKTMGAISIINEHDGTQTIQIFPNPTDGQLKITNSELGITNVKIFDVFGRTVVGTNLCVRPETTIDISNLSTGVYFIHIQTEEGIVTRKVVKR